MSHSFRNFLIVLKRRGFFFFIPDKLFYSITYRMHCVGRLNWKNPQTFSEKLNWLKLYYRVPELRTLVDKVAVRDYVAKRIGGNHLIETYGVFSSFEEIDFSKLPKEFVIKCNHDSGSVKKVNKEHCDRAALAKFFNHRLKIRFFHYSGREWPYKGIKPKIIVEKLLSNPNQPELLCYKFYCFNGEPKFIQIETGEGKSVHLDYYDLDFNRTPFKRNDHPNLSKPVDKKPVHFQEMLEISKSLSCDLPFVRVDLYEAEDTVYFGELTLYPGSGFVWFSPDEWNYKIGGMIDLSCFQKRGENG